MVSDKCIERCVDRNCHWIYCLHDKNYVYRTGNRVSKVFVTFVSFLVNGKFNLHDSIKKFFLYLRNRVCSDLNAGELKCNDVCKLVVSW